MKNNRKIKAMGNVASMDQYPRNGQMGDAGP